MVFKSFFSKYLNGTQDPPSPFMEKSIFNFHFDHWNPFLRIWLVGANYDAVNGGLLRLGLFGLTKAVANGGLLGSRLERAN